MKRVLIVGCGFPQLSLVRAAKRLGLYVIGADANPRAIAVGTCDEFHEVSTADADALGQLVRQTRADAVTTTGSEVSLKATALVAERLQLPFYANSETVRRCQDKDTMRAAYAAGGLGVPPFARCELLEEARAFAKASEPSARRQAIPGVRPAGRRSCRERRGAGPGIRRGAGAFWPVPDCRSSSSRHGSKAGEYSVNGWIEDGALVSYCVTERITVSGRRPLGVMIAEVYPSGLSPQDEARVVAEARRGAIALGHARGPCYSQVALGTGGCFLLETAARLGGGFDADVTRLARGVNLYDRVLGIALGDGALEGQGVVAARHGGAIARFCVAANRGTCEPSVASTRRGLWLESRTHRSSYPPAGESCR